MWDAAEHLGDDELVMALDRELPVERQSECERHLQVCAACAARRRELRAALSASERLPVDAEESEAARRAARAGFVRALHELAAIPVRPWRLLAPGGSRRAAVAYAASVLLAVIAVSIWWGGPIGIGPPVSATDLPMREVTPGAVSSLTADELCGGARPSRLVPEAVRRQVLQIYGMEAVPADAYELDALVTPELGGTVAAANLWPQRYDGSVWNAYVKDELEEYLREQVCRHRMALADAQREIAGDWIAAYKRHFKSETPRAGITAARDEEQELFFVPSAPGDRGM